jgi:hypothetical protein
MMQPSPPARITAVILVPFPRYDGWPFILPGLEFKIADGRIEWQQGPAKLTAAAVIAGERWGTDMTEAEQWLNDSLANGSRPAKEVVAQARECGISKRTLDRAKVVLGVRSEKRQIDGVSCWFWSPKTGASDANRTVAPLANNGALA